ncbi:hypothetical protein GOP47_0027649 [Adiantum capillus-veneris]|nr:hypothetical protein GOP47_0027649 [Adiantum capillus-veneris]
MAPPGAGPPARNRRPLTGQPLCGRWGRTGDDQRENEKLTGLTVMEQLFNPATSGLVWFAGVVQLFTLASIIPFANGESTDARRWGPFNAKAERWNGRLAMIGFAALLVDEMIRQGPLLHQ